MKPTSYKYLILFSLFFLNISCDYKPKNMIKNQTWEKFKEALVNDDIEYLIKNSNDSIKCIDCRQTENEKLQSNEYIFKNYKNNFFNKKLLNRKEYSVYQKDTLIRINYSFENKFGDESYNIIYTFEKKEKSFLLTGMITVP